MKRYAAPLVAATLALAPASAQPIAPPATHRLTGPLIEDVTTDRVLSAPGRPVEVAVALRNSGPSRYAGRVALTLWNGRGQEIEAERRDVEALDPAARTMVRFTLYPPAEAGRGYLVGVRAEDASGRPVDAASGALDVGTDWRRFPRYGWVSRFEAGTDAAGTVDLLAAYHLNALQFYDVAYKAHVPEPPVGAPAWPNLANRLVSRAVVNALLSRAHERGMIGLMFTDWAAAYSDYATDGSGARLAWGLFTRPCSSAHPCGEGDQDEFGGGPGVWRSYGWAADSLALFDPSNPDWQRFLFAGVRAAFDQLAFDGWQIDTLGRPDGPRYAFDGRTRRLGDALAGFANAAREATGRRTVLNTVSRWREDEVAAEAKTDILYSEIHPEFGDTPFYPALNGVTARLRQSTTRPVVLAAYMDQGRALSPPCRDTPAACTFAGPGVRLVDSAMLAAGAAHFELGDRNPECAVPQPKMASNIFLPGPMLCMDAGLAGWVADAANFAVGYENLLRDGVSDAVEAASLAPPAAGSALGEAGKVYLLPKTKAGFQILHLLNFTGLPTIRLDDRDGTQPAPRALRDLVVTMHYAGPPVRGDRDRLMWASPDVAHGAPQRIAAYATGEDAAGRTVTFTLPSLAYWDMVWLETEALAGQDFATRATSPLRGSHYVDASPGAGSFSTALRFCCGQWARFADVRFGHGARSVIVRAGTAKDGARLRLVIDRPDGAEIATVALAPAGGLDHFRSVTAPVSAVTGTHDLYLVALGGGTVGLESLVFR